MKRVSRAFGVLAVSLIPVTASAQWISLGLRGSGGVPTGTFAEDQSSSSSAVMTGAKNGFGYGLEAGAGIGPIGAYAGFDHIRFDCQLTSCTDEGSYTLQGASNRAQALISRIQYSPTIHQGWSDIQQSPRQLWVIVERSELRQGARI
jgi:hypothetical protein